MLDRHMDSIEELGCTEAVLLWHIASELSDL